LSLSLGLLQGKESRTVCHDTCSGLVHGMVIGAICYRQYDKGYTGHGVILKGLK